MKRGTTPTLKINIQKISINDIDHIDFVFKEALIESAPTIITRSYPKDVSYDESENVLLMPFTEEETRLFSNSIIYMDTRIVTNDGKIPATNIARLKVCATLFDEVDNCD